MTMGRACPRAMRPQETRALGTPSPTGTSADVPGTVRTLRHLEEVHQLHRQAKITLELDLAFAEGRHRVDLAGEDPHVVHGIRAQRQLGVLHLALLYAALAILDGCYPLAALRAGQVELN